jgi:broad specificity phosphatase PhoE
MAPKIIFLRHAQAEHNVAFHTDGDSAFLNPAYKDAKLTEEGLKQARAVGKELSKFDILDIWSSSLTRCIQTTLEVYEEVNCNELFLHDNLLERQGGGHICNERKSKTELLKDYPYFKMKYLPDLPAFWGEREDTYTLHQRMFMLLKLLQDIYKDEDSNKYVLIVSHADAIFSFTNKSLENAKFVILTFQEIFE